MPRKVKSDHEMAVEFLKEFHPGRLWTLTAILPDHKETSTDTFNDTCIKDLLKWLEEHDEHNIYFSVGEPKGHMSKKAERIDIQAVHYFHVDVDPRVGEDLAEEQKRILKLMKNPPEGVPAPSFVIYSGGGYQSFWKLEDPIHVGGSIELAKGAARYNMQLELLFQADACHNIDRIMRLPGTVNRPDEKKRKKGRTEKLAKVVISSGLSYHVKDFIPAPEVQEEGQGFNGVVSVSTNVEKIKDIEDLPSGVSETCKVVIVQGFDPDKPNRWSSRSEALFWICCQLIRAGCDDDLIYAVITDPDFEISKSVLDKRSNVHRYAVRQIERAREFAVHPRLMEINAKYAVIGNIGGKCRVLTEEEEIIGERRRSRIHFQSFADFANFWCNKFIEFEKENKKTGDMEKVKVPVGKWWLNHELRREFRSVIFAPGHEIPNVYNMWKGFAFDARPGGDCSMYLDHVREVICRNDEEIFRYVIGWMARAVQHPGEPGHTAIVLRGRMGTGKGVFANTFGALFGRHFLPIRDSQHLFGQFNAHLRDCVVLFADEAFWAGNTKHEKLLLSMITEEMIMSEQKHIDAEPSRNYIHLIMASNADWVIPAAADDRRFLMLDVGDSRRLNIDHFDKMDKQMKNGGYEALLHFLMTYDLENFNVRNIPQTDALLDQKERSRTIEGHWWQQKLHDGKIFDDADGWPEYVFKSHLQFDFSSYCRSWKAGIRSNSTRLGKFMTAVCPPGWELSGRVSGKHNVTQVDGIMKEVFRPHVYVLPSLKECRKLWMEKFGGPSEWPAPKEIQHVESETENKSEL